MAGGFEFCARVLCSCTHHFAIVKPWSQFSVVPVASQVKKHNAVAGDEGVLLLKQLDKLSLCAAGPCELSSAGRRGCLTAKRHLESIAELYKFSVSYTDFPKV